MSRIALQQITSHQAELNELSSLRIPIKKDYLESYLTDEEMQTIKNKYEAANISLWGAKYAKSDAWANMIDDSTLVLFRKSENVVLRGISTFKVYNEELAKSLWGIDSGDGETWPLIYFLKKLQKIDLKVAEVNSCLGYSSNYNWQGLNTVKGEKAEKCIGQLLDKIKERRI